ncbi:MAG: hypothetical protein P8P11_06485, partial [Burkholderiales bacterium]|nr:hypothetical protein [Burkholderiales bacterium]
YFLEGIKYGMLECYFAYGIYALEGTGGPQDVENGLRCIKRSAERGFAYSQFYLGMMYFEGHHVAKDYDESKKWVVVAATNEHQGAIDFLESFEHNRVAGGF